jgi:ABC-2 type transport system ATP-binding protein
MIQTYRLSRRFTGVEALHDLSLDVPENSIFALVGPNGAGKTTAIKTVMNILRPTSGRAEVLGVDSRRLGPAELSRIGYVSENQQMPDWMTLDEFMQYCRPFYSEWNVEDEQELLNRFELPARRKLRELSRGMRIKAAVASSLAYRPRLLVMDEPFSGLDVLVREELIECLLDRASGMTIFLASHDLTEIESFASHVGYLHSGRLQFVEETAALSERFRDMEVTLDDEPAALPSPWPAAWLVPQQSGPVVRFVDSRFENEGTESKLRGMFPNVREVSVRPMGLRAIFVALAKAARREK